MSNTHKPLIGVYPGTFDPITRGHMDLICRAATMLDRLIIAVAANDGKGPMFSLEERLQMIGEEITACDGQRAHIEVSSFGGLLIHFCREQGARYVKVHPCITGLDPAEERWRPFYRRMRELGLPLMCHTGPERAARCLGHQLGDPAGLELPLSEGLTVIAAHAGTGTVFDRRLAHFESLVRLMERHERLYADSAAVAQAFRWKWLARLRDHPLVRSRLLHGSDFPIGSTALPWGGLSWKQWRGLRRERNPLTLDYRVKEAVGFGRESAERAARVLGIGPAGEAS